MVNACLQVCQKVLLRVRNDAVNYFLLEVLLLFYFH